MTGETAHILISGWYGVDNAGDDAILIEFIRQLVAGRNRSLTVLSERPEGVDALVGETATRAAFHYDVLGARGLTNLVRGRLWAHLREVRRADLFVLGGGGLLRDNTSLRNVLRLVDELWLARLFGRRTALYAIGAGPFLHPFRTWLIRRTVARCDLVTVRDARSRARLEEIGVPPERIHLVADPAFLLEPVPCRDAGLLEAVGDGTAVGLFPSQGFVDLGRDRSHIPPLARALDRLHERHGLRFVALPMRRAPGHDDVEVARWVRDRMVHREALHVHTAYPSAGELKWLSGRFRFNITVRLHALIFSLGMDTPAVAVNYEPKVAGVLGDFGLDRYLVAMGESFETDLVDRVELCMANLGSYAAEIAARLPAQQERARETFRLLEQLLAAAR